MFKHADMSVIKETEHDKNMRLKDCNYKSEYKKFPIYITLSSNIGPIRLAPARFHTKN